MQKINKIFTIGLLGATLAIGFTGCIGNKNLQPKTVSLKAKSKSYTFVKKDPIDNKIITKDELIKTLNYNSVDIINIKRKYIKMNDSSFSINLGIDEGILCKSKIDVNRKFKITENDTSFIFTLFEPNKITFSKDAYWENLRGSKLCMPGGSEDYAKEMVSYFPKKIILQTKKYNLKGEENTKFPDRAVYANFKRILGQYNWEDSSEKIDSTKKQNTFSLMLNDKVFPLYVEVYPYRDGSKVTYSTTIEYDIDSSEKPTFIKQDIEKLKLKIQDIINN